MKKRFAQAVSLRELKPEGMRVYLAQGDRFPADNQEVPLRGVYVFVEIHAEGEEHGICVERLPVRKFYSLPEHEGVCKPIGRELPGLGQGRFRQLRCPGDMDEGSVHDAEALARCRVR